MIPLPHPLLLTFYLKPRMPSRLFLSPSSLTWGELGIVRADLLGCRKIHYESELVARPTGRSTKMVTFLSLIGVVALFVGCATIVVFLSRLLIWDCST